eukprot:UC1_evm1s992
MVYGAFHGGESTRALVPAWTKLRFGGTLAEKLAPGKTHADALREATAARIAAYVKEHPNVSEDQLARFIKSEVDVFERALKKNKKH